MTPLLLSLWLAAPPAPVPAAPAPAPAQVAGLREDPFLPGQPTVLGGHADGVQAFAFSPDGTRLATAGRDRRLRLWVAATGAPLGSLELPAQPSALAWSADGLRLAVGSPELQALVVVLTDPVKPEVAQTLAHPEVVMELAFSPDGATLAVAGAADTGALYPLANPDKKVELRGRSVAWLADGKTLLVANGAGPLALVDAATGKPKKTLSKQEEKARALQSADGKVFASWAPGGLEVKLWTPAGKRAGGVTLPKPAPVDGVAQRPGRLTAVALSRDGQRVLTASSDGQLRLWPAKGDKPLGAWPVDSVAAVGFSPDGAWVVAADGALLKWWKAP